MSMNWTSPHFCAAAIDFSAPEEEVGRKPEREIGARMDIARVAQISADNPVG